ncbi:MAG: alkaline phosphatase family protein [Dehalococcoidales bacterium]|nr:alkaline phosphatase family protein [Dehalococcoidales bacterium]
MGTEATKVMVLGIDGPFTDRVYQYAQDGKLPTIKSLIDNGAWTVNCMVPFPTITPPNWTSIATGAFPGTHGITCFNAHNPGDDLHEVHQAFLGRENQAEALWSSAARAGKHSIVLNWPSSYGITPENTIVIGGYGVSLNEWRATIPEHKGNYRADVADDQLFSIEPYPFASGITLRSPAGWQNLPAAKSMLEADLKVAFRKPIVPVTDDVVWRMLVVDPDGKGYDRVLLCSGKDASKPFAELRAGEWSANLYSTFKTEEGDKKAVYRIKLLELAKDASRLRIYVSPLCSTSSWSHPAGVMGEIESKEGLPIPYSGFSAIKLDWIDLPTFMELNEFQHIYLADATSYLLQNKPWDLFFIHYHMPDWIYHVWSNKMDPATNPNPEEVALYQDMELKVYQSIDRAFAQTLKEADEDTLIAIVSDHGGKATTGEFHPAKILTEAGLTVFKDAKPDEPVTFSKYEVSDLFDRTMMGWFRQGESREIDWSKTRAVMQRSCYVYVNVKGRDPHGIVEPGEEYEKVRDEVIRVLYDYTDPVTGKKPITFALRKEDARVLGLHGDRVGDIVFGFGGYFGRQHGGPVTTAQYGIGSLKGLLMLSGPGVKRGVVVDRTCWIVDMVPTICYLTGIPVPRNVEGSIIYQALEDPEAKSKELDGMKRAYDRMQKAYGETGTLIC